MRCGCVGQNEMRMRISFRPAHVHLILNLLQNVSFIEKKFFVLLYKLGLILLINLFLIGLLL